MPSITNRRTIDQQTLRRLWSDFELIYHAGAFGTLRGELPAIYRECAGRRHRTIGETLGRETAAHEFARLLRIDPAEVLALADSQLDAVATAITDLAERVRAEQRRSSTRKWV